MQAGGEGCVQWEIAKLIELHM
jgi:hypothetical protein